MPFIFAAKDDTTQKVESPEAEDKPAGEEEPDSSKPIEPSDSPTHDQ